MIRVRSVAELELQGAARIIRQRDVITLIGLVVMQEDQPAWLNRSDETARRVHYRRPIPQGLAIAAHRLQQGPTRLLDLEVQLGDSASPGPNDAQAVRNFYVAWQALGAYLHPAVGIRPHLRGHCPALAIGLHGPARCIQLHPSQPTDVYQCERVLKWVGRKSHPLFMRERPTAQVATEDTGTFATA